jgi:hypothetical protein
MRKSYEFNNYRKRSLNKSNDKSIVSKIADYQTSITDFSTRLESKKSTSLFSSSEPKRKVKKFKEKKRVEFNPLITVINIQSYKKENFTGEIDKNDEEYNRFKKCEICNII